MKLRISMYISIWIENFNLKYMKINIGNVRFCGLVFGGGSNIHVSAASIYV